jgi:IS5 family transposase
VTFPLDVKLRYRALIALVQLSKQHDLPLRQSYLRVAKFALMMSGRYRHAEQMKRARRVEKFIQARCMEDLMMDGWEEIILKVS